MTPYWFLSCPGREGGPSDQTHSTNRRLNVKEHRQALRLRPHVSILLGWRLCGWKPKDDDIVNSSVSVVFVRVERWRVSSVFNPSGWWRGMRRTSLCWRLVTWRCPPRSPNAFTNSHARSRLSARRTARRRRAVAGPPRGEASKGGDQDEDLLLPSSPPHPPPSTPRRTKKKEKKTALGGVFHQLPTRGSSLRQLPWGTPS